MVVGYGRYELVVLYHNCVIANMGGQNATMKQDDYDISLVKFDKLVLLLAKSTFVFPPHVEQVLFADDLNNLKAVLIKSEEEHELFMAKISYRR